MNGFQREFDALDKILKYNAYFNNHKSRRKKIFLKLKFSKLTDDSFCFSSMYVNLKR